MSLLLFHIIVHSFSVGRKLHTSTVKCAAVVSCSLPVSIQCRAKRTAQGHLIAARGLFKQNHHPPTDTTLQPLPCLPASPLHLTNSLH